MPYADKNKQRSFGKRYRKTPRGKEAHARSEKKYAQKLKAQVVKRYCGEIVGCQCSGCRTTAFCFLSVDHKNRRGPRTSGKALWLWIIRKKFPKNFQVLCWNCNCAKRNNYQCPMAGRAH